MKLQDRILVVDDSSTNRKILKRILALDNYEILEAENGQQALETILNQSKPISIVLLDLSMPVMDGFELLKVMENLDLFKKVSVIVTTGFDVINTELKSLQLGAIEFITKPYNADIVRHRVRSILKLRRNTALINTLEVDPLTGLYNRESFYLHAKEVLLSNPTKKYQLICSDIINFKMLNTKYGAEACDNILTGIANFYKKTKDGIVCGRLGSDIFVVLREMVSHKSQEEVNKEFLTNFSHFPIKDFYMKFGVYEVESNSTPVSIMCDCARLAITTIKNKYGATFAVYDISMRKNLEREQQLTSYMEQALEENQFKMYLQPKHNSITEHLYGAEALVRWVHPVFGLITPDEFIPIFEKNGFISKLDYYMWEEACKLLKKWIDAKEKIIPISVNVSRIDFLTFDLPSKIYNLVESYNIPPSMLHLEITESAYTTEAERIIADVKSLRMQGFLIEMDDFGSGYSSLNMLAELPIDILKLDMKFIHSEDTSVNNSKMTILNFVIGLSKWLKYPTIAEGVEKQEEVELLKSMGCNYIQGYFYSKPISVNDFESYKKKCFKNEVKSDTKSFDNIDLSDNSKPLLMLTETDEEYRQMLTKILSPYYTIAFVNSCTNAYEFLVRYYNVINCIVLDLLMPDMDAFRLVDILKEEGYIKKIPVVMTSEAELNNEKNAIQLGATSFVPKPFDEEILLHHIKLAVNEYELRKLHS